MPPARTRGLPGHRTMDHFPPTVNYPEQRPCRRFSLKLGKVVRRGINRGQPRLFDRVQETSCSKGCNPRQEEPWNPRRQAAVELLLVHGAFADGSIWGRVIETLQHARFNVVASRLPLTSFTDDVKTVKRDLVGLQGPTVVVGHSYLH
jgi:pimeloyl-ACP methyl ester carboxylesterase